MTLAAQKARRIGGAIVVVGWVTLGSLGQLSAAEIGRVDHGYSWQNDVEILIDGSHLLTMPETHRRNEKRHEEQAEEKDGPSICHQANSTTWSTREQKCPDPKPPERSRVWSTSPE
nr:hypothetical protein [uncultured Halomonas sp.]